MESTVHRGVQRLFRGGSNAIVTKGGKLKWIAVKKKNFTKGNARGRRCLEDARQKMARKIVLWRQTGGGNRELCNYGTLNGLRENGVRCHKETRGGRRRAKRKKKSKGRRKVTRSSGDTGGRSFWRGNEGLEPKKRRNFSRSREKGGLQKMVLKKEEEPPLRKQSEEREREAGGPLYVE